MENFFSILGGMGTMATESFVRLINHRTKATKDQEYLNYVLFNHATVPDRTAYILDRSEEIQCRFCWTILRNKIYCDQTSLC